MSLTRPLALAAAFAAAGALAFAATTRVGRDPADAMPAGSFLVASVDVAALRASPLGGQLLDKDLAWGKLADLTRGCGFDPITRIQELDLAIPEEGDNGDFGVAFSADLTQDELVRCAESIARERGETRAAESVGHFRMMEDEAGRGLAVRETGSPVLVGKGAWLRAMIAAAERRAPRVHENAEHAALRESLAARGKPLLLVTALLPKPLRDRMKHEMEEELGDHDERAAPNQTMAGVLGVSTAGLAVRAKGEDELETRAELRCESDAACAEVRKIILAKRLGWSQNLALRALGFGPLIDGLDAVAHGPALTVTTRARTSEVAAALDRLRKFRGGEAKQPAPPARSAPQADEVLRARPQKGEGDGGR